MSNLTESLQQAQIELAAARQRIAELESRLREVETQTNRENYHLLSESIPDGLIIFTVNENVGQNRILEVNENACQLLGYPREELLNKTLADLDDPLSYLLPPDLRNRLFQGEHIVTEQTHRRKDGRLVPVEIHARLGMLQGQPVIVSLTHDISRRKTLEEDLRRFEAAIRQTEDAVIITDAPHNHRPHVLFANQAFTRITGYTLHEAQEKDITILQRPGTRVANDPDLSAMHQAALTHGVFQGNTHSFHKDGQPITLHWSISPITDRAGATTNFVAVVRDVTHQEQQIQQMQTMTQDLQNHRDHLNAILESMQDALLSLSLLDRRIVHVSASFEEVFGYPAEQFINNPDFFAQVVHPDDLQFSLEMRQRALSEGFVDFDHRIVLPNGKIRWLHRRAWVNYDAEGRPIRVNDSARDITRQKLAEEAWRSSEELYRSLIESADASISLIDAEGCYLFANARSAGVVGGNPEAMIGRSVYDFFAAADADDILADVQWVIQSEQGLLLEPELKINGESHWFRTSVQPVRDSQGVPYAALIYASEITERKLVEQEIHRQNEILQQAHDLIALADTQGRITYINQAGAAMIGLANPAQLIGRSLSDFHSPEDARRIFEEFIPTAINQGQWRGDNNLRNVTGHDIPVDQTIFPIREANGDIKLYATIIANISERKQAEEALRQNEMYLRSLVGSQTAFSIRVDMKGNISYCNQRYNEQFGWFAPSLVGVYSLAMILPEDHAKVKAVTKQCVENPGKPVQVELRKQTQNGGFIWTIWEFIAIQDTQGNINEVQCMGFDITKQKLAEAELQAMNARLEQRVAERTAELEATKDRIEAIFDHSADAILLLHIEHGLQQTNHAFDLLFNAPSGGCLGHRLSECFSLSDAAVIERTVAEVSATRQTRQIEAKARRIDGTLFDVEISLAPVNPAEDRVENLVCIIRDVTERKQAQEAIRESEERYRTLITIMSEGIVLQGRDGAIHTSNEAAAEILGLSMDQLLGRTSIDPRWHAVHEDGSPFVGETHPAMVTLHTGEAQSNVIMGVHKPDGSLTWISINARPVFKSGQSQPDAVVVTFADVSQRMETEKALQRALVHEKELGELKSRFVTMASHEFRTPLAAILATTETLAIYRHRMDGAQIDERLERIRRQVLHMKGLMEDVLQMARMQTGRIQFKPETGALDALCLELIEEAETQDQHRGRISFTCSQQPLHAHFDTQLMRQVIGNILSNALKYSPTLKPVQVSLTQAEGQVQLRIQDEGIGIPEEDQPHLFEPFHRAQNVGAISGTGLGLSIAKQALDLHHGTIHLESRVDAGTAILISFPNPLVEDSLSDENIGD